MNCAYHVGVELVPLPRAPHRHAQTKADPDEVADVARVDLRCPVPRCPCVASLFVNAANKKDCRRCGRPIEEWWAHRPHLCKACFLIRQNCANARSRTRAGQRASAAVRMAARRRSTFNPSTLQPASECWT